MAPTPTFAAAGHSGGSGFPGTPASVGRVPAGKPVSDQRTGLMIYVMNWSVKQYYENAFDKDYPTPDINMARAYFPPNGYTSVSSSINRDKIAVDTKPEAILTATEEQTWGAGYTTGRIYSTHHNWWGDNSEEGGRNIIAAFLDATKITEMRTADAMAQVIRDFSVTNISEHSAIMEAFYKQIFGVSVDWNTHELRTRLEGNEEYNKQLEEEVIAAGYRPIAFPYAKVPSANVPDSQNATFAEKMMYANGAALLYFICNQGKAAGDSEYEALRVWQAYMGYSDSGPLPETAPNYVFILEPLVFEGVPSTSASTNSAMWWPLHGYLTFERGDFPKTWFVAESNYALSQLRSFYPYSQGSNLAYLVGNNYHYKNDATSTGFFSEYNHWARLQYFDIIRDELVKKGTIKPSEGGYTPPKWADTQPEYGKPAAPGKYSSDMTVDGVPLKLGFNVIAPPLPDPTPVYPIGEHHIRVEPKIFPDLMIDCNSSLTGTYTAQVYSDFDQQDAGSIERIASFFSDTLYDIYSSVELIGVSYRWLSLPTGYNATPSCVTFDIIDPESNIWAPREEVLPAGFIKNPDEPYKKIPVPLTLDNNSEKGAVKSQVEAYLKNKLKLNRHIMTATIHKDSPNFPKKSDTVQISWATEARLEFKVGDVKPGRVKKASDLVLYEGNYKNNTGVGAIDLRTANTKTELKVEYDSTPCDPPPENCPVETPELYVCRNAPEGFAEIKDNQYRDNRADRSAEEFEAMAGIPTTKTLYINSGSTPLYVEMVYRVYRDVLASPGRWVGSVECSDPGHIDDEGRTYTHSSSQILTAQGAYNYIALEQLKIQTPEYEDFVLPGYVAGSHRNTRIDKLFNADIRVEVTTYHMSEHGSWANVSGSSRGTSKCREFGDLCKDNGVTILNLSKSGHIQSRNDKVSIFVDGREYKLLEDKWYPNPERDAYTYGDFSGDCWPDERKSHSSTRKSNVEAGKGTEKTYCNGTKGTDPWVDRSVANGWPLQQKTPQCDWDTILAEVDPYVNGRNKPYFDPIGYIGVPGSTERNSRLTDGSPRMFGYISGIPMELTAPNGVYNPSSGIIHMNEVPQYQTRLDYSKVKDAFCYTTAALYKTTGVKSRPVVKWGQPFNDLQANVSTPAADYGTTYLGKSRGDTRAYNEVLIHNPIAMPQNYQHIISVPENTLSDQRIPNSNTSAGLPKTYIDFDFEIELPHNADPSVFSDESLRGLEQLPSNPNHLGPGFTQAYQDTSKWIRTKWVKFNVPVLYRKSSGRSIYADELWSSAAKEDYVYYEADKWIPLYDDGRSAARSNDPEKFTLHIPEHQPDKHRATMEIAYEAVNAVSNYSMNRSGSYTSLYVTHPQGTGVSDSEPGPGVRGNPSNDRESIKNTTRAPSFRSSGLARQAAHLNYKQPQLFDIIGRIGNVIVDDSTDPRWSDVFWRPNDGIGAGWLIPNISRIPIIAASDRALFYSDKRGYYDTPVVSPTTSTMFDRWRRLTEYHKINPQRVPGNVPSFSSHPFEIGDLPIGRGSNPKQGLANRGIYLGYPIQWSFQTVGSYWDRPVNVTNNYIFIDMYGVTHDNISLLIQSSGTYKEIWRSGVNPSTYTPDYKFRILMTLGDTRAKNNNFEKNRSGANRAEKYLFASDIARWDENKLKELGLPAGYVLKPNETMTFMGGLTTNGKVNKYVTNSDVTLSGTSADHILAVDLNAQRWHAKSQLPSSTIVRDLNTGKLLPMSEGMLVHGFTAITTSYSSGGQTPWDLQLKPRVSYTITRVPLYRVSEAVEPTEPIGSNEEPIPAGTFLPYLPQDIPLISWETGQTSADDARLIGTH